MTAITIVEGIAKKETTTVVQRVGMKNVYSLLSRFGRGIENCSSEHTF